jgi:hypothetical protein
LVVNLILLYIHLVSLYHPRFACGDLVNSIASLVPPLLKNAPGVADRTCFADWRAIFENQANGTIDLTLSNRLSTCLSRGFDR